MIQYREVEQQETARALARRLLDQLSSELLAARQPLATYRVQLHAGFDFAAAEAILPYLARLGVSDLYTSPLFTAAPGSTHGYDVVDHQQISPELGGEAGHERLVAALRANGLGHLLDIVPNHMGASSKNALWRDLLENGPSATSARFFDVDWHPVKEELTDKVLLPVLGDRYGAVLERGEIKLALREGAFEVAYWDNVLPINPRSYVQILSHRLAELEVKLGPGNALDELKSILTALENMPLRREQEPVRREERRREKEVVKRRLGALVGGSPEVSEFLEENVRLFNGEPGKPRSFDLLDRLLGAQAYRLAHWRVSSEEINYRRFFDINALAALRVEDPVVFEETHRLALRLVSEGKVSGLRIDHPDGLAYPTRYFSLLQETHVLNLARALAEKQLNLAPALAEKQDLDWQSLAPALHDELQLELRTRGQASPFFRPLYVVAEKILGRTEHLPAAWAVRGTTGYDFLNSLNGIFVETGNAAQLEKIYARFIGGNIDFDELCYQKKKLILYSAMASEMNLLARKLNRISEGNRWTRDFTLYALRAGLIELVACFPVYRTYLDEEGRVDERDRRYVLQAVAAARRRNPAENWSIYEFIADILLQKFAAYVQESERPVQLAFAIKLQQVLGPVMAKGVEDTAFYVYNRLVSLNEVGGEPQHFGTTVEAFHEQNAQRARHFPRSLLATSTHDTKRGEDARVRIDALSELPEEWRRTLPALARSTEALRREVDGRRAPDRNEELLLFQTLLGVWPNPTPGQGPLSLPADLSSLRERMQQYLTKATKEAKVNTSWLREDTGWEQAVTGFVGDLLALPARHAFWKSFLPLARRVAQIGMHNSISQLLLKLTAPGVPDLYQGAELWDLSLVDPDNRRPVDYGLRMRLLDELRTGLAMRTRKELVRELYEHWEDGHLKLYLTQTVLQLRRERPLLFGDGGYLPLVPEGPRARHLAAFARTGPDGALAITVAPRLLGGLLEGDESARVLPPSAFANTLVPVPGLQPGAVLRCALTGEGRTLRAHGQGAALAVDELFGSLPLALLVTA